jgi:hypothetical protein
MHCKQSRLRSVANFIGDGVGGLAGGELKADSASPCSKVNSFEIARVSYMAMDTKRLTKNLGEPTILTFSKNRIPNTECPVRILCKTYLFNVGSLRLMHAFSNIALGEDARDKHRCYLIGV